MKASLTQQCICDVIHCQQDYWRSSNDITSPSHLTLIEEECFSQLQELIEDEEIEKFEDLLKNLYWFVRKFDNR